MNENIYFQNKLLECILVVDTIKAVDKIVLYMAPDRTTVCPDESGLPFSFFFSFPNEHFVWGLCISFGNLNNIARFVLLIELRASGVCLPCWISCVQYVWSLAFVI